MNNINREIELNRIIGEMAGMLKGLTLLCGDENVAVNVMVDIKAIKELLKRYDDFFKWEK